jgi:hypothetical protein
LRLARTITSVLSASVQKTRHVLAHRRQEMQRRSHCEDDFGAPTSS